MLEWHSGERTAGQYGTWTLDPVISTALYWRYSVAVGREAGAALGPELYHELRYEDLIAAPGPNLQRLCGFLDLPYAEVMTRFHEGKTRIKPGRSSKAQWLPPTAGLRDWRTQLASEDVERIEIAVDELLDRLGYESRFEHPTDVARDRVAGVHQAFTAGALARDRVMPRGWERC
jgi:hypothetical protein